MLENPPNTNPTAVQLVPSGSGRLGDVNALHDSVLFVTGRGIERIAKTGGESELILADANRPRIVATEQAAYWIREGQLLSLPLEEAAPETNVIASDLSVDAINDNLLFVDQTHAYLWVRAVSEIRRVNLDTGEVTLVAAGPGNLGWYFHGGYLYYIGEYDDILRVPVSGGQPERITQEGQIVWTLATDGTRHFFGGYGVIVAIGDPMNTMLLTRSSDYIDKLVLLGDRLLYETGDGLLGWVSTDGSRCPAVADSLFGLQGWSYDEEAFYVAYMDALYRIPM